MWRNIFRSFKFGAKKLDKEEIIEPEEIVPIFDAKYKIVIKYNYGQDCGQVVIDWLNDNSISDVHIEFPLVPFRYFYIGFEDPNDALVFKIKFSV